MLNLHRALLRLRQEFPIIKNGTLNIVSSDDTGNGFILGIKRELGRECAYIFINFADAPQSFSIPENGRILASTHPQYLLLGKDRQMTIPGYCGVLLIIENC